MSIALIPDEDDGGKFVDVKYTKDNNRISLIWLDHDGAQFVIQFTTDVISSGIDIDRNKKVIICGVDVL